MIQCGIGVGVGWGSGQLSPGALVSATFAIFGQNVIGVYLPEDVIWVAGNADQNPGRVGETLTNETVNRYQPGTINGRLALTTANADAKCLGATVAATVKTVIAVAVTPTLPLTGYAQMWRVSGLNPIIVGEVGSSLYNNSGDTYYVDGVATRALTVGVHSYAATHDTGTNNHVWHGHTFSPPWQAAVGVRIALSIKASAQQIADFHNQVLRPYYRF